MATLENRNPACVVCPVAVAFSCLVPSLVLPLASASVFVLSLPMHRFHRLDLSSCERMSVAVASYRWLLPLIQRQTNKKQPSPVAQALDALTGFGSHLQPSDTTDSLVRDAACVRWQLRGAARCRCGHFPCKTGATKASSTDTAPELLKRNSHQNLGNGESHTWQGRRHGGSVILSVIACERCKEASRRRR